MSRLIERDASGDRWMRAKDRAIAPRSRPPTLLRSLALRNLRGYASLDLTLGPGPQLIWGPNAAGKTTLLEAIVLLALGRSHRTGADAELIRWGADFLRVEGGVEAAEGFTRTGTTEVAPEGPRPEVVALVVTLQDGGRKRIEVNGVPRHPAALAEHLRTVLFAPEEMLLVIGPPTLRRTALDELAAPHDPMYRSHVSAYTRALGQRNSLLRQIRDGEADRAQLRYWDEPFLASGAAIVAARMRLLELLTEPLAAAHREIAPAEEPLTLSYATNAPLLPGETPREALARRLGETAEKEAWNGTTLVGPHRDDLVFGSGGRDLTTFASRGQQRTAILALKLAELDLLTALDGRPPLLLLDDVFSELDPMRRGHLVRRIAELPQALITTTEPEDLDPDLRRQARAWRVVADAEGTRVEEAGA
ncbi:MAG: DNA replication/repair protein RecF [Candidatus Limnocylindrales bacterium]|jgi:DNA replication and repair protein RecF